MLFPFSKRSFRECDWKLSTRHAAPIALHERCKNDLPQTRTIGSLQEERRIHIHTYTPVYICTASGVHFISEMHGDALPGTTARSTAPWSTVLNSKITQCNTLYLQSFSRVVTPVSDLHRWIDRWTKRSRVSVYDEEREQANEWTNMCNLLRASGHEIPSDARRSDKTCTYKRK